MREITEFRCRPETLSATVVRNILAKVRSHVDINFFYDSFDFRHGRYRVTAICRVGRCAELIVQLLHRSSCETWIIRPFDYPLLPPEAFDLPPFLF